MKTRLKKQTNQQKYFVYKLNQDFIVHTRVKTILDITMVISNIYLTTNKYILYKSEIASFSR